VVDKHILSKTIVDYTSPALCTPVTPFPPIGDAAYHQHAAEGPSHGHRQHAQNLVKVAHVVPEISCQTDRQTDTQTDILITIFRNHFRGEVTLHSTLFAKYMAVIILFHFWLFFDVFACAETIYMMTKVKLILFLCILWQKSLNQRTEKTFYRAWTQRMLSISVRLSVCHTLVLRWSDWLEGRTIYAIYNSGIYTFSHRIWISTSAWKSSFCIERRVLFRLLSWKPIIHSILLTILVARVE